MRVYFYLSFFTKKQRTFANKNEKQIDMARNRNILLTLTIESPIVLVASMMAFRLHETVTMPMEVSVFILVAIYACLKTLSILCSPIIKKFASMSECSSIEFQTASITTAPNDVEIQKQRMELFHQEYQYEQQQYVQRKENADEAKLQAVLKYTKDTFKNLDFDEAEIFQLCECVRYFVTNKQPLTHTDVRIKRRASVTQIALKNFAWNIAFQYNIGGDATALFVMHTFNEWFTNSTLETIRKNLRTTTGRHKIEINEKIISDKCGLL